MGGEVDKTETTALALLVASERRGSNVAVLLKELAELVIGSLGVDVLDVDVGEVGLHLVKLTLAVLLGDMVADVDLLLVEKHAVDVLDGLLSSLVSLVVNEAVSLGVAVLVLGNLAAQNVPKGSKGVMESLVVNGDVKVLDEDVALASLAEGRVALRPHDAAGTALDKGVVEFLEGLLAVGSRVVVHVGVAERTARDSIAADTDRSNGTNLREELEEHSLSDGGVELANIERSRVLGVRGGRVWGRARGIVTSSDVGVNSGSLALTVVDGGVVEIVGELINSAGVVAGRHFVLVVS